MDFFGIGPGELVLVLVIAVMIFGPGKLPEFARGLGRAVREFRKYSTVLTKDFKDEFEKELQDAFEAPKESTSENKETPSEPGAALAQAEDTTPKSG